MRESTSGAKQNRRVCRCIDTICCKGYLGSFFLASTLSATISKTKLYKINKVHICCMMNVLCVHAVELPTVLYLSFLSCCVFYCDEQVTWSIVLQLCIYEMALVSCLNHVQQNDSIFYLNRCNGIWWNCFPLLHVIFSALLRMLLPVDQNFLL